MSHPYFVDIFSGAGGSTLGFVQAGFRIKGALELDRQSAETFKKNFMVSPEIADANNFDFKKWANDLGDVDVLVGCPPCQGFSRLKRKSHDDPRNSLIYTYIKAIRAFKPRIAVFENVRGLVSFLNGEYFKNFTNNLKKIGYTVNWKILNSADYGTPQIRRRVIILASFDGKISFPPKTHGQYEEKQVQEEYLKPWKTVKDAINDLPPINPGESHPSIPNHQAKKLPFKWLKLIKAIPKDGGSRKDAPRSLWLPCHRRHSGHGDVFGRLSWNKPAITITTGCWDPSKGRFTHPEQDRGLSLRECARLQGFPDSFIFYGSGSSISRQIGNALPPPLARAIAKHIRNYT